MVAYNKNFELDMVDIDMVEAALRQMQHLSTDNAEQHKISELLGRIHHQKQWYRPTKGPYVGG
jgi:hypothetical protein